MTQNVWTCFQLNNDGWVNPARHCPSPNCDARQDNAAPSLLVIHNISLPPFEYGSDAVERLFTNQIDAQADPFFSVIAHLRVSSHFFIRRDGELVQFVPIHQRAWHAGVSNWRGRERCNDFSIGIELEGCDFEPYTEAQYETLIPLAGLLKNQWGLADLAGHEDIAPGRKTDPGAFFDWVRVRGALGWSK